MQQARFHHANMLVDQLCATINTKGTEVLAILQDSVIGDDNPPIEVIPPPTSPPAPAAKAVEYIDV